MSHDISLRDCVSGEVVRVLSHEEGGTRRAFQVIDEQEAVATEQLSRGLAHLPEPITFDDLRAALKLPPGSVVRLKGRIILTGDDRATINITSNYAPLYHKHIYPEKGIRWLYGKPASQTTGRLEAAVKALGTARYDGPNFQLNTDFAAQERHPALTKEVLSVLRSGASLSEAAHASLLHRAQAAKIVYDSGGYWVATPGNAGAPLATMLQWAQVWPDAVWEGD